MTQWPWNYALEKSHRSARLLLELCKAHSVEANTKNCFYFVMLRLIFVSKNYSHTFINSTILRLFIKFLRYVITISAFHADALPLFNSWSLFIKCCSKIKICINYINTERVISCSHLIRRRRNNHEVIRINCHAYEATTKYTNFGNNKQKKKRYKLWFLNRNVKHKTFLLHSHDEYKHCTTMR